MSNQVYLQVDFGQKLKKLDSKSAHLKDKNGNEMMFNSMVAALNYLKTFNYHVQHTFNEIFENSSTTYFLLEHKTEKSKDD